MARRRGGGLSKVASLCSALALSALAGLLLASAASADVPVCETGQGAGQCAGARGLALDQGTGRLHVAEEGNDRIGVYAEDGSFLFAFGWGVRDGAEEAQTCGPGATPPSAACLAGKIGSAAGQLNDPAAIAVDPADGSIYVGERRNFRVQKFDSEGDFLWTVGKEVNETKVAEGTATEAEENLCPFDPGDTCGIGLNSTAEGGFASGGASGIYPGVGPGGALYVLDSLPLGGNKFRHRLQRFDEEGTPIPPQCVLEQEGAPFEAGRAVGLAVEAGGDFWVSNVSSLGEMNQGIRKYGSDAACAPLGETEGKEAGDAAVEISGVNTVALDEAGRLFATGRESEAIPGSHPPYPVVTAHDGAGQITRRFGYDRIASQAEGIAAREGGIGGVFVSVNTGVVRLESSAVPPDLPPPGPIVAPSSVAVPQVGSSKATARAEINPEGKETKVHFEFLTREDYEDQGESFEGPLTRETPEETLAGEGFRLVGFEGLIGCPDPATEAGKPGSICLVPETEYLFRVIATNADNPTGEGEGTVEGPPFITPEAPELGEAYALAVGTDTARLGADVNPQGSLASGHFEYVDEASFQEGGFAGAIKAPDVDGGEAPLDFGASEELVSRSASIGPLAPGTAYRYRIVASVFGGEEKLGEPRLLRTFSVPEPDPSCPNSEARIGPGAFLPDCRAYELVSPLDKAGGDIQVLVNNVDDPAALEQSADSGKKLAYASYRSFGDAPSAPYNSQYVARRIPGSEWQSHSINPPRQRPFYTSIDQREAEYLALSADLCRGWLRTFADIDPLPHPPGYEPGYSNLLLRDDELCAGESYGALAPLSEPPSGSPVSFRMELMGLSADGSHAIFSANDELAEGGSGGPRQLYESVEGGPLRFVCFRPGGTTVGGACTAGSNAPNASTTIKTGAISADGERIFFTDTGAGAGKLYVRVGGAETREVSKAAEEEAGTSGSVFWAAAKDGSAAIFTSGGRLYRYDAGAETTSAPLAEGVGGVLGISEDASRIYFASSEALSGEGEGEGNSEGDFAQAGKPNLYLREGGEVSFVATLDGLDLTETVSSERFGKRTSRVTPDGAHAAFASVAPLTGYDNKGAQSANPAKEIYLYDAEGEELTCASCNPSRARPAGAASIPAYQSPLHAARVLAEDGSRLYFQSADRLSARDTNGAIDVYQWERLGAGGCEEGGASFSIEAGGCIDLISSGQSRLDSRFVEADPSARNAFFITAESLLPQDYGLADVYDARIGGGLPVPPPPPGECEGEACQDPPPPPEDPTPASSAYRGPENVGQAGTRSPCARMARKAKRRSRQAKSARRAARRMARKGAGRRAGAQGRRARRLARGARGLSRKAKRCRARKAATRRGRR